MYTTIRNEDIQHFVGIVGAAYCSQDLERKQQFSHDETEDLRFLPEVVLAPQSADEVAQILKYCSNHMIPVTPIGARTGLSGGALCVYGGVALSLERLNRILYIDEDNLQVITQPAVIVQELQEAVAAKGLYYAPDPASRGTCFIGGNLAENSGGPRAVKYGVTKDWVLNLEVVLPTGQIIRTGANTLKNSTGYNLTQLFVGSEGTLGVITEATLKLIPKPTRDLLMLVPFTSATDACAAVAAIFKAGVTPSAMEFMERDAIEITMNYTGKSPFEIAPETAAHLLIEVDGHHEGQLMEDCEKILAVVEAHGAGEVLFADDQARKDALWFLRRRVGEAVKAFSVYKEEDTVVPRFKLPELLTGVKAIGDRYGFQSVCYGHAGDGNLHVNILKGNLDDQIWDERLPEAITELFELVVALGGTLSGEHGIGHVQKNYMPIAFSGFQLDQMWGLKKVFDPHLVMNPGKVFPDKYWR
jgi:glycolate oxidase